MKIKRRGLSPVVASVLLILLVIVIVGIIFGWARGFILDKGDLGDAAEGAGGGIGVRCSSVDFEIVAYAYDPLSHDVDPTEYVFHTDYQYIEVVNKGNVDITGLDFKIYSTNGESKVVHSYIGIPVSDFVEFDLELNVFPDIKSVEVYPILEGNIICYGNGVDLFANWDDSSSV